MIIDYPFRKCITCSPDQSSHEVTQLTNEHIIPGALGGILQSKMLCKDCNSLFGNTFEAKAKVDPAIRTAIAALRTALPKLYISIENGHSHLVENKFGVQTATLKNGKVEGNTQKLEDGSLLVPEKGAPLAIKKMAKQEGLSDTEIEERLHEYSELEVNTLYKFSENIDLIKHANFYVGPNLKTGSTLDRLVSLKIAFEFLALVLGNTILKNNLHLNNIRRALRECKFPWEDARVEILQSSDFETIHGLFFEGNKPHAIVQVRLFGKLAYRVHFLRLIIDERPFSYTHYLENNQERFYWEGGD